MTDHELAQFLGIAGDARGQNVVRGLPAEKRALYERMAQVCDEWNLHEAGLGPRPQGVLIDTERSMKRRRVSRAFIT